MLGNGVDCSAPRASGVTCTNTTPRPIFISVGGGSGSTYSFVHIYVNGVDVAFQEGQQAGASSNAFAIVPVGANYSATITVGSLTTWNELR